MAEDRTPEDRTPEDRKPCAGMADDHARVYLHAVSGVILVVS